MADLNKINYDSNEIIKFDDMDFGESIKIANLNVILKFLLKTSTGKDLIFFGLNVQERSTPSMNVDLTIGLGFNVQDGTVLHTGSQLGPIAIDNGEAGGDRIDVLEAKVIETDYDSQQRAFKDPSTGNVNIQTHNTKTRYTIQTQITKGTAGSGVAPNHTSGWVKLAEITVPASESTAIYNSNIKNVDSGYESEANTGWTAETTSTIRINTLAHLKDIFRLKHTETGDHNDDVIQEQHIDWGLGGNQISAEDVPIRDTAGLFTATNIENALQELYNDPLKHLPIGTTMMFDGTGWVDNSSIPGWYADISANSGQGCPDMVNKFAMGKVISGSGATGGSNTHTISSAELPVHTHAIDHDHASFSSGNQSANHTHDTVIGSHRHSITAFYSGTGASSTRLELHDLSTGTTTTYTDYTDLGTKTSGNQSASHNHLIDVPNYIGSSGDGGFANNAIDTRPAYYSMIYIRKCA